MILAGDEEDEMDLGIPRIVVKPVWKWMVGNMDLEFS